MSILRRVSNPVVVKLLLLVALCFGLSGCFVANLAMEVQVLQYSGDGEIHNSSIFFSPGYRIEFPKFTSARPYQASYRLSHVPHTPTHDYATIYLRFDEGDFVMARKKKDSVTAAFRLELYDANGNSVHSAELHLSNSYWSEAQGLFGVFDLKKSDLRFERNASYVLKASYMPGDVPPPAEELYFSIEEGGTK
jgi:hypothetical protein